MRVNVDAGPGVTGFMVEKASKRLSDSRRGGMSIP